MKKKKYRVRKGRVAAAAAVLLLLTGVIVFLCVRPKNKGNNPVESDDGTVNPAELVSDGEYIEITQEDCNLYIGSSIVLKCRSNPEDYALKVIWTSDSECVSVDQNGKITVNSPGIAAVTATYGVLSDAVVINAIDKETPDNVISQLPVYKADDTGNAVMEKPAEDASEDDSEDNDTTQGGGDKTETRPVINETKPSKDDGKENTTQAPGKTELTGEEEKVINKSIITTAVADGGFIRYIENTYIYLEDGNYLGEVIIGEDYVQIYVMTRTKTFDSIIKKVIGSLVGDASENVYAWLVSATEDSTFSQGGHKIRIVAPVDGGHAQLMLYY